MVARKPGKPRRPTKRATAGGGKGGRTSKAPLEPVRDTSRDGSADLAQRTRLAAGRLEASGHLLGQTVEQMDGAKAALAFLNKMVAGNIKDAHGRKPSLRDRRMASEAVLHHTRVVTAVTPGDEKALEIASGVQDGGADIPIDLGELLPTTKVHELPGGDPKTNGKHEKE